MSEDNFFEQFSNGKMCLEDIYAQKLKIYTDKDGSHLDASNISQSLIDTNEENELNTIRESVIKGKTLLTKYLDSYSKTVMDRDFVFEQKRSLDTMITDMKDKCANLMHIANQLDATEEDMDTIQSHLDGLSYSVDMLSKSMSDLVEKRRSSLSTEINSLTVRLKNLSEVYAMMRGANTKQLCPICMTHDVDSAFSPCGHCVCSQCVKWRTCYICRQKVEKIQKLYFV